MSVIAWVNREPVPGSGVERWPRKFPALREFSALSDEDLESVYLKLVRRRPEIGPAFEDDQRAIEIVVWEVNERIVKAIRARIKREKDIKCSKER